MENNYDWPTTLIYSFFRIFCVFLAFQLYFCGKFKIIFASLCHDIAFPDAIQAQIDSLKKQIAKLQSKTSHRHNNLVNKLDEVDNFDSEVQSIQRDITKAGRAEKSLKPVASDVKTIKEQQKEFKVC